MKRTKEMNPTLIKRLNEGLLGDLKKIQDAINDNLTVHRQPTTSPDTKSVVKQESSSNDVESTTSAKAMATSSFHD